MTHPCILCGDTGTFKGRPCPGASHNPDLAGAAAPPPPIAILGAGPPAAGDPVTILDGYGNPVLIAAGPVVFVQLPGSLPGDAAWSPPASAAPRVPSATDASQVDPMATGAPTPPGSGTAAQAQPDPASAAGQPPAVPGRACCSVAARSDAATIDQQLRDQVPYRRVWSDAVARKLGVLSEAAVYRHKGHVTSAASTAAIGPAASLSAPAPPKAAAPAPPPHATAPTVPIEAVTAAMRAGTGMRPDEVPPVVEGLPAAGEATGDHGSEARGSIDEAIATLGVHKVHVGWGAGPNRPGERVRDGGEGCQTGRTIQVAGSIQVMHGRGRVQRADHDELAYRLDKVTIVVAQGLWRGISSVGLLAQQFGCTEQEVLRLHKLAAAKVAAARGGQAEQLEGSVAGIQRVIDEDTEAAASYMKEAQDALRQAKSTRSLPDAHRLAEVARAANKLAHMHRTTAMAARQHLDKITIMRPEGTRIDVRVSVQADPDFDAAFQVMALVLDAFFPGATELVTEAIGVFEEGGVPAVEEWLANRAAMTVTGEIVQEQEQPALEA